MRFVRGFDIVPIQACLVEGGRRPPTSEVFGRCPLWVKSRHVQRRSHVRFTPESDIKCAVWDGRYGPKADIGQLFDQLVSATEQLTWNLEAKRFRRRDDEELKVGA